MEDGWRGSCSRRTGEMITRHPGESPGGVLRLRRLRARARRQPSCEGCASCHEDKRLTWLIAWIWPCLKGLQRGEVPLRPTRKRNAGSVAAGLVALRPSPLAEAECGCRMGSLTWGGTPSRPALMLRGATPAASCQLQDRAPASASSGSQAEPWPYLGARSGPQRRRAPRPAHSRRRPRSSSPVTHWHCPG